MSAVDRMAVRVRGGGVRCLPRRQALALIAAGRAEADRRTRVTEPPAETPTVGDYANLVEDIAHRRPATIQFQPDGPKVRVDGTNEVDAADVATTTPDVEPPAPQLEYVSDELDADAPTVDAVPLPPEPKPSARRDVWAEYAGSLGVEVTSDMTKRDIQTAAEEAAQSLSNLPQPALPGGRLETPEDEPAAETVADDQDPRTR